MIGYGGRERKLWAKRWGIVALPGGDLADNIQAYFFQSEQSRASLKLTTWSVGLQEKSRWFAICLLVKSVLREDKMEDIINLGTDR